MRKLSFLLAAFVVCSAARAEAPKKYYIEPPAEYDHPYKGELFEWTVKDQAELRAMCPNTKFNLGFALACTMPQGGRCWMFLVPDDEIKKFFPLDLVKRHEIAHCNGWPGDHRGARAWQDWAAPAAEPAKTEPMATYSCGLAIQKPCEEPTPVTVKPARPRSLSEILFGR